MVMDSHGPILVYDKNFRHFTCTDEEKIRDALLQLILLLRSCGLDNETDILKQLAQRDVHLPVTFDSILLPRIIEYIQPRFHATNFRGFQFLGGGGFGTVFKAEHNIDGRNYAIKVTKGIRNPKDLARASLEVSIMSRLRHENVVQYITSWIEYGSDPLADDLDVTSQYYSSHSRGPLLEECNELSNSDIEEVSSSSRSPNSCSNSNHNTSDSHVNDHAALSSPTHESSSGDRGLQITTFKSRPARRCLFMPRLFIQLELCNYNLAQWLEHRNNRFDQMTRSIVPLSGPKCLQTVPHAPARWLADQLASGLAYLHANKMMHRDLKPENVLLSGPPLSALSDQPCACEPIHYSNQEPQYPGASAAAPSTNETKCYHSLTVKICDFGLSRFLNRPCDVPIQSLPSVESSLISINPKTNGDSNPNSGAQVARHSPLVLRRVHESRTCEDCVPVRYVPQTAKIAPCTSLSSPQSSSDTNGSNHTHSSQSSNLLTGHLGSALYAAPEVRPPMNFNRRLLYDYKADIYSMGVIFFQLFHPFSTVHELITCLQRTTSPDPPSASPGTRKPGGNQRASKLVPSVGKSTTRNTNNHSVLPTSFVLFWPDESCLVDRMLRHEPTLRPSATELLYLLAPTSELPSMKQCLNRAHTNGTSCNFSVADQETGNEPNGSSMNMIDLTSASAGLNPSMSRASHRLLDFLLWRNQELEHEVTELRARLARYEVTVHETCDQASHEDLDCTL